MMQVSDKVLHFGACFVAAAAVSALLSAEGAGAVAAVTGGASSGMALGIGKEYGDRCAPGNKWDWADIVADALGTVAGSVIVSILFR